MEIPESEKSPCSGAVAAAQVITGMPIRPAQQHSTHHDGSGSKKEGPRKRIGILTGGGDCPGLNAVIRAACLTCSSHDADLFGFKDGFEGLWEEAYEHLNMRDVSDIYNMGGTILGTTNRGHFGFPLQENVVAKAVETYKKLRLDCLICVGGDGTMSIAHTLSQAGINVIGVPKTIDNDLACTDQTFGFDSAVSVVTSALDRLHTTAFSHHRVMVVEVMGRNAGWIALAAGLAGGANVILIPEIKWSWETLFKALENRSKGSKRYSLVCVAEGAVLPSGGQIAQEENERLNDKLRLGGVGKYVAEQIEAHTDLEARVTVLGHTQRGGSPSSYDRILATKYGSLAALLAVQGSFSPQKQKQTNQQKEKTKTQKQTRKAMTRTEKIKTNKQQNPTTTPGKYGQMVSLRGTEVVAVPITSNMRKQKLVDPLTDQMVLAARNVGTIFGDEQL
ncbi:Pfka2p [Balamuthia mandrillaris]